MASSFRWPTHILDLLKDAATCSHKGLVFLDNAISATSTTVTYAQLYEEAQENGALLRESGVVKTGCVTITYFDTHQENVLWFWSVVAAGGICAVLSPVSNEGKSAAGQLENLKSLFGDATVLTNHKLSSIFATKCLTVKSIQQLRKYKALQEAEPKQAPMQSVESDDIAAILFTSGSTGHSKAVKFSHAQLVASVHAKANYLSSRQKNFMSWISFDHSANFCEIHLQAMYVGSDQIHVPTADLVTQPYRFFQILSAYKIGYTFSPNFFLAAATTSFLFQDPALTDLDLSDLSVIICGGETNRTKTLEACDNILREFGAAQHCIKAAYGLSETCSACFYNLQGPEYDVAHGNTFATVGKHLPGVMEMKLVPCDGDSSCNDKGVIYLRGDTIFKGYYNNDVATKACMTEDGWMNTGDIGVIDHHGNLRLLGRQEEIIILNGNNYSSFELEYALETSNIEGLTTSYTVVFSTWDAARDSEAVVVLFNPSEAAIGPQNMHRTIQAVDKCVFRFCAQRALHVIPLPKVLLPKSSIGKLSSARLKQQYETGAFSEYMLDHKSSVAVSQSRKVLDEVQFSRQGVRVPQSTKALDKVSPLQKEIAQVYASIVNIPPSDLLGPDALLSSGINSLGFIRLKKALEKKLKIHQKIPMPLLIRCHSIEDLEHELVLIGTLPQLYDPIVPLAVKGSKQPLFLLHPGAGEFLCWISLLKYLPDRPVYAVRAKGLHPGEGTFGGLPDLLCCYYKAIRSVQPSGPYALLGYCFGGLLSFELAKMFQAAGETVVFCGGIDNPPCLKQTMGQVRYRSLMIDVLPVVTDLTEIEARVFADKTASLTDEEFYELLFTKFSPEFIENMDITVPRLQAFGRVEDCMRKIVDQYTPEGQASTMDIFCADPMPHFNASPESWRIDVLGQWRSFITDQNVRFHEVKGTHISLIKEPLVNDFQGILNKALEARGI